MSAIEFTDEEIYVIKSALEEAYDSWRKENGPALEYLASEMIGRIERKLPGVPAHINVNSIYTQAKDSEMLLQLRDLESRGELTPEAAAKLLEQARERDIELESY